MNIEIFKSIVEDLDYEICLCDVNHTIIYMNKASKTRYHKRGNLIGKSLLDCHNERSREYIIKYVNQLIEDKDLHSIYMAYNPKMEEYNSMVAVRDDNKNLIAYYERHDVVKPKKENCL